MEPSQPICKFVIFLLFAVEEGQRFSTETLFLLFDNRCWLQEILLLLLLFGNSGGFLSKQNSSIINAPTKKTLTIQFDQFA